MAQAVRWRVAIGFESGVWGNLRGSSWRLPDIAQFGTMLACCLGPRDRVADVWMRLCGIERRNFMKKSTALVTTVFAMASFPLLAQQSAPASPETQQSPSSTMPQSSQAAAPVVEMSPVNGELVSKLDSKTAKAGDSVVVQTKAAVKTADGTEIPKGSKLMGHVMGVHASEAGDNSQVVLKFDQLELKGGQSVPIQSQIQSIGASAGANSAATSEAPAAGSATAGASSAGSTNPGASGSSRASGAPQSTAGGSSGAAAQGSAPAAGTVVARTGNIAIRTTSVPGVLVANNEPGQRDPRMAQASSILLGAKQDVQLDTGTQMVVGVSSAGGGTQ
jgi:hypothetical protein